MKKMKFYLILLFVCIANLNFSQSWQWANGFGGTNLDVVSSMAVDSDGNSIVVGYFLSPTISFGNINFTLSSLVLDGYVTKLDSNGVVLWAKQIPSSYVFSVTTDSNNDIIVCGNSTLATIDFGNGVTWNNDAPSISNLFITKYNSNGDAQWTYSSYMSQASGITPSSICSDNNNNIYCSGIFSTIHYVGFSGPDSDTLEYGFNNNSFLLKLNSNGTFNKVSHAFGDDSNSSTSSQGPLGLSFGKDNKLYLVGSIQNVDDQNFEPYVRKLNSDLTVVWTKIFDISTEGDGYLFDIDIDNSGNLFTTGVFDANSLTFGTNTLINPNTNGERNRFVCSLNSSGDLRWQKLFSQSFGDGNSTAMSPSGSVYIGGTYRDTMIFNVPASIFGIVVYSINPSNGSINWTLNTMQDFSTMIDERLVDVDCDNSGRIFVTGNKTEGESKFGNISVNSNGYQDVFVARIGSSGSAGLIENNLTYFDFYPNPLNDELLLASDNSSDITIEISDVNGKVIYKSIKRFYQSKVDVSKFQSGIYLLNVYNEDGKIFTGKLLK